MTFRTLSGPLSSEIRRTWWISKTVEVEHTGSYDNTWTEDQERRERVGTEAEAMLIASLTENGYHAPALDLDFPVEVAPAGEGITRLRFPSLSVRPRAWSALIAFLAKAGITPRAFAEEPSAWGRLSHGLFACFARLREPQIDVQVPIRLAPSCTPGHHHLFVEMEMPWAGYLDLCRVLHGAGLIEEAFFNLAQRWKKTMLWKPGIKEELLRKKTESPKSDDGYLYSSEY